MFTDIGNGKMTKNVILVQDRKILDIPNFPGIPHIFSKDVKKKHVNKNRSVAESSFIVGVNNINVVVFDVAGIATCVCGVINNLGGRAYVCLFLSVVVPFFPWK